MRTLIATTAIAAPWGTALAHVLPASEGVARQLGHQLGGGHHMPLLVIVGWLALLAIRAAAGRRKTARGRPNRTVHRDQG
jgi:hypothetical protein